MNNFKVTIKNIGIDKKLNMFKRDQTSLLID